MSAGKVQHVYEVVEHTAGGNVQVGGFMVADKHVRKDHEPLKTWTYLNLDSGKATHTTARHLGEYEKLKEVVGGYRDARNMKPVLRKYADGEWDGGEAARGLFGEAGA